MYHFAILAFDIAREHDLEAQRHHQAVMARAGQPSRPSFVRTTTARALASVSRGSAAAVRRLDAGVAEDLAHGPAPAE